MTIKNDPIYTSKDSSKFVFLLHRTLNNSSLGILSLNQQDTRCLGLVL